MLGDAVGDRRLDRDLGEVAQDPLVGVERVASPAAGGRVRPRSPRPPSSTWASWNVRRTVSIDPAHALRVGVDDRDRAELVERALGGHRRRVDPLADEREVRRRPRTTPRG